MKKTNNKLSKWCKSALMLPAVAVVLTFASCQNDDLLFDAAAGVQSGADVLPQVPGLNRVPGATIIRRMTLEGFSGDYLAGPTAEGENLYDGTYIPYEDSIAKLWFLPTHTSGSGFASGGIALSQWNDTLTAGWQNQCSVYYKDPTDTTRGGHNGSKTFAVHYGYNDTVWTTAWDGRTVITFNDTTKTCVFSHFYVCNNTYAVRSMEYGDDFAKVFSYADQDWFKLVIEGISTTGSVTGRVEFYLADFREEGVSPGIIKEWTRVDLHTLGAVTAIRFDMRSSDTGQYGMNTPAYFCFDDLVVTLP